MSADLAARDREILRLNREGRSRAEIVDALVAEWPDRISKDIVANVVSEAKRRQALVVAGGIASPRGGATLTRYEAAKAALVECVRVDEAKDIRDKAIAIQAYARQAKDFELQANAVELRERATRRLGILIKSEKDAGRLSKGGRPPIEVAEVENEKTGSESEPVFDRTDFGLTWGGRATLAELGVTKKLSSEAQRKAGIPDEEFESRIRLMHTLVAEGRSPESAFRSAHNAGRVEDAQSLDYSPTPPWATRALFEHVLLRLGYGPEYFAAVNPVVWEPACGEGHMSAVLQEYCANVVATDIHDYSVAGVHPPARAYAINDFLADDKAQIVTKVDWIVTNPPFGERVLPFMRAALKRASVGVALFLQLRYLEGVDRYEEVFRDRPPTLVAPFVERVPLHMGRYEPDGSTMTAFMWLVWVKGQPPLAPFWIPPGCRERLTKPDDRTRFTAHPVLPPGTTAEYGPETGEIATKGSGTLTAEPEETDGAAARAGDASAATEFQAKPDDEANVGPLTAAPAVELHSQAEEAGDGDRRSHSPAGSSEAGQAGDGQPAEGDDPSGAPPDGAPGDGGGARSAAAAEGGDAARGATKALRMEDAGNIPAFLKRDQARAA